MSSADGPGESSTGTGHDDDADDTTASGEDTGPPVPWEGCPEILPADWIVCEDFEGPNPTASLSLFNPELGALAVIGDDGMSGTHALRIRHVAGQNWSGAVEVRFGQGPAAAVIHAADERFEEVWLRIHVKTRSGWPGGGHGELLELQALSPDAGIWSARALLIGNETFDVLQAQARSCIEGAAPLAGCDGVRDYESDRLLTQQLGDVPIYAREGVEQWRCLELHVRLNELGKHDGLLETWIDGVPDITMHGLDYRGSWNGAPFNRLRMASWWPTTATMDQERLIDDIVLSRQRVHCNQRG